MEIKKIITPVDFEKNTNKLVEFALYMANQLSAEIVFCHVFEPFATGDMMLGSPTFVIFENERKANAEERMTNLVKDNEAKSLHCSGKVLIGDITDEIVAYAKDADMIIMGTHGAKGLEKILLDSVAERVLKRANCPCLIMNPYKQD